MVRKFIRFPTYIFPWLALGMLAACSGPQAQSTSQPSPPVVETPLPAPVETDDLRPLAVAAVTVEIGSGSPIPVEAVVSGDWPDPCAQLARVDSRYAGGRFEISLLASPAESDCPPDAAGVPYRIPIPLNMVELQTGSYSVTANGMSVSFDWDPSSSQPPSGGPSGSSVRIAYIGPDGNVWTVDWPAGETRQLTTDADPGPNDGSMPTAPLILYYFPAISSDGKLVAFRRDFSTPASGSVDFTSGLWVHDLETNEALQVYDRIPAGLAWRPGTHQLAFGMGVDENYFIPRGQPNAELATSIREADMDTGAVSDLVLPERGLALYTPIWSPDGRFLAFDELTAYEGRGNFAFYDFEAQEYVNWDEPLGLYNWSPDGEELAYDYLTYTATGTERIFLRPRQGGEERMISPDFENNGYAFNPVYSPQGDRIAYLASLEGPDSQFFTLFVQDLAGGEPRELGIFESAFGLAWTPDGSHLIFSAGPWPHQRVLSVDAQSGASAVLAQGSQPAVSED